MLFFFLALNVRQSTMALRKQHKMFVAAYNKPRCSTSWFKVAAGLGGPPIWGQLLSLRFLSSVAWLHSDQGVDVLGWTLQDETKAASGFSRGWSPSSRDS